MNTKLLYIDYSLLHQDFSKLFNEHFYNLLNHYKEPDTIVNVASLPCQGKTKSITLPKIPYYYDDLFKLIDESKNTYDGVMLGCSSDPGIREAQILKSLPIFAPLKSALHNGGLLGKKIAIICPANNGNRKRPVSWHEDSVASYNFRREFVRFYLTDVEPIEQEIIDNKIVKKEWKNLLDLVLEKYSHSIRDGGIKQAKKAVSEGAEVVYFACTIWSGMLKPISDALEVPVIDPVISMLKTSEMVLKSKKLSEKDYFRKRS